MKKTTTYAAGILEAYEYLLSNHKEFFEEEDEDDEAEDFDDELEMLTFGVRQIDYVSQEI